MTYATKQNLIDRYTEAELAKLTDELNGTVIDDTTVSRALGDADTEIDGYAGALYAVPLDPVPGLIQNIACRLARYFLYTGHRPDHVRQDFDDAIATLKRIAKGEVVLPGAAAAESGQAAPGGAPTYEVDEPVFTNSALGDFR